MQPPRACTPTAQTCCAVTVRVGVLMVQMAAQLSAPGTIATVALPIFFTPFLSVVALPPETMVAMSLSLASRLSVTLAAPSLTVVATVTMRLGLGFHRATLTDSSSLAIRLRA